MSVEIESTVVIYKGWTTLSKVTLREDGKSFHREVEDHGQAVAVLPYDPERRIALLVQLPRTPVMMAGAAEHLLEAPAGLIDDGETADSTVRREAHEECGVALGALDRLGEIWTSPGVSTERTTLYLAAYTAADRTGAGGGLADEHENIVVVERPLSELAALADAGRLTDMKTFCLVQTLRLKRPEMFAVRPIQP